MFDDNGDRRQTLICSVCGKTFPVARPYSRRETCSPECNKLHNAELARKRERGEIEALTPVEIRQLFSAAKKTGAGYYLAFRLAINGALKLHEILELRTSDIPPIPAKAPCFFLLRGKTVELDCETASALGNWIGTRKGRLFPWSRDQLRKAWRKTLALGKLYDYTFHALRHTGILQRVRWAKTMPDLETVRKNCRFRSLKQLNPYLRAEPRVVRMSGVK